MGTPKIVRRGGSLRALLWPAHRAPTAWFSLATLSLLLALGLSANARAHEIQPAVADLSVSADSVDLTIELSLEALMSRLDLTQLEGQSVADSAGDADYDRLRAETPAALEAEFRRFWPEMRDNIRIESEAGRAELELLGVDIPEVGDTKTQRFSVLTISAGAAPPVTIGWAREYGRWVVRQVNAPRETAFIGALEGGETSPPIDASGGQSEGALDTFARYIFVGFEHILPLGLDHILFVLGLYFLAPRLSTLLWQVSAFTLAHTVTLALGLFGVVEVSPSIVEPLIAASIVYVAVENVFTDGLSPWRMPLVFAFGLLHGLGFASVLQDFGLPDGQYVPALIGFNLGVEFGQLAVIALAFLAVGIWARGKDWYKPYIAAPASIAIALIGAYWVVERTLL